MRTMMQMKKIDIAAIEGGAPRLRLRRLNFYVVRLKTSPQESLENNR